MKNETAVVEIILKGQQPNATMREMEAAARQLRKELRGLPTDSQAFADKTKEFQQIDKRLKSIQNEVKGVGGVFQSIGKEIKAFGILAAGYLGFDWLSSSVRGIIKSNAELSDSLADIRKTTGMTEAEARKLNTALSQINTRTATKELRNIAIVGGQLGIAKNDIFGFTVAVDKMNVALGDEFTGGAEEVTKAMGGLRNIFSDIKTDKVDEDLLHIGNAINELASSGAATGPVVSDFANRIGGVGITLGLTSGQVLGLSATLQELNVSTERGGTAVTKILQKMTTNTAEFAKVAQMPLKEFTDLVNKDLYGAFIKVVEGSKKSGVSATAFGKILDNLGVDGAGASEVFAKLGNATDLLDSKVKLANNSLKGTSSIMAEFNTKNTTLGAEMDRLSKGFASAFTNSAVTDGLKSMVGWLADLFDKTKKVSEQMEEERKQLNFTRIQLQDTNLSHEKRVQLIEELKAKYPEYLSQINAETVSNTDLEAALQKVNEQLIGKILIQRKQEQIDEALQKQADLYNAELEQQEVAQKHINKAMEEYGYKLKTNLPLDQQALEAKKHILAVTQNYNNWLLKELDADAKNIQNKKSIEAQTKILSDLEAERIKLSEQFGITNKKTIDYTKLSVAELNKFIEDSNKSMGNYHREEAIKSIEELKRREKEKQGVILETDEETKKKLIEEHKHLLDELDKLEREHALAKMPAQDAELARVKDFYDALRKRAKGNKADLKRIEILESDDIMNIIMKNFEKQAEVENKAYFDKIKRRESLEKQKEQLEKTGTAGKNLTPAEKFKQETIALNAEWDKRISDAEEFNHSLYAGEEQYFIDIEALRKAKYEALNNLTAANNSQILESEKELNQKRIAQFEQIHGQINQIVSTYNQIQTNEENKAIEREKRQTEGRKAQYKRLLDAKVISRKDYDKKIAQIDKQQEEKEIELKRKQALREKRAAIVSATINTALSISKALSSSPPPLNYVLAALAGALGAVQIAAIASQPLAYAKGGFNRTSDDPQGYTTGPTLYTKSASGRSFIAGEAGGEWIAPAWMLDNPVTANIIEKLENIRSRGFASGGATSVSSSVESGIPKLPGNSSFVNNDGTALISAINRLNENLENGIAASLNYDNYTRALKNINAAKQSARIG